MMVLISFNTVVDKINAIKKNVEALLQTSRGVCPEINAGKTKHMFMSNHQNAGQIHNSLIANKPSESVASIWKQK
jgi:hypothetical protein